MYEITWLPSNWGRGTQIAYLGIIPTLLNQYLFTFSAFKSLSKLWPIRIVSLENFDKSTAWTSRSFVLTPNSCSLVIPLNLKTKFMCHLEILASWNIFRNLLCYLHVSCRSKVPNYLTLYYNQWFHSLVIPLFRKLSALLG